MRRMGVLSGSFRLWDKGVQIAAYSPKNRNESQTVSIWGRKKEKRAGDEPARFGNVSQLTA
ncbi:MAG: hypothetical protein Q4G24_02405 [Paracoccus sp. (in: a-proteobacteria)]|uniref:hypothetical protein n=1 Tax=Paracoccus sp. TaxID=267 RepID=UPI0026E098D4|nr:hypothetical protein [Paracoccus sp. (in: a-proteobacteria)]MDO5620305.1 hypothetical protein [Paracoccus sp. (in: a-proteobacteria)]